MSENIRQLFQMSHFSDAFQKYSIRFQFDITDTLVERWGHIFTILVHNYVYISSIFLRTMRKGRFASATAIKVNNRTTFNTLVLSIRRNDKGCHLHMIDIYFNL